MKKSAAVVTIMLLVAFTGCSNSENTGSIAEESSTAGIEETEETTVQQEETEVIPTDRVRDIQSADDFEYEIVDGYATITGYNGDSTVVEIPDSIGGAEVTEIGFYCFEAKYDIVSVTLPETITLIGEGAFMDCESLESVNIPENVTGIDRGAFVGCVSLTEVTIPASVQYVREEAFTWCDGLTSLTIENPSLEYENWGLEDLDGLTIHAEEGSPVAEWAADMGKLG
jgi:hypothetical protein